MKENRRTARPLEKIQILKITDFQKKFAICFNLKKNIIVLHVFNIGHISKNDLLLKNMYKYSLFSWIMFNVKK